MSSVIIAGNTSGTITLDAPAVAGTTTLTLPATSGTVALTASPTFTGQATIPTINLTGGQITFPATAVPSADANTLDDYEEGTFTPSLSDGTNSVAIAGGSTYTKIGRMVYVAVNGYNTNFSALSASAALRITGLPFTATAVAASQFNLATNNLSTYSCVAEIYSSTIAYVYLANNTIDYNNATRNNLVSGASTFSFRTSFFYFAT
jgi:hypothetical protein